MQRYEYKVVPAPAAGIKSKVTGTPEGRFAEALQILMNEIASEGWEYQRAESLPSTERSGLTAKTTRHRHVLLFRRAVIPAGKVADDFKTSADKSNPAIAAPTRPQTPEDDASQSAGARRMLKDNGVEELSDVSGLTSSLRALAAVRKSIKSDD
jgi:hypothetical protein